MPRLSKIPEGTKIRFINEHFAYEVEELLYSSHFFLSVKAREKELTERGVYQIFLNTALDHSLLHARSLLEFYYYGDRKSARAIAYLPHWKSPEKSRNIQELERRVNSEIVHLGWKRLDVVTKGWNLLGVVNELLDVTDKFLSQLDQKFFEPRLKAVKGAISTKQVKTSDGLSFKFIDLFEGVVPIKS
jgi:hypothetical protein